MRLVSGSLIAALLFGCAADPSRQLVSARQAYAEVSSSRATHNVPTSVYEAKQALARAERAFDEDPGSAREISLAYVAERSARLAATRNEIAQNEQRIERADQNYIGLQQRLRENANDDLADTRAELREVRQQLAVVKDDVGERTQRLQQQQRELEARERALVEARERRADAERKLADAKARLEEVANVTEEAERVRITLDGAVLFRTGEAQLLPTARAKLDRVADVLKARQGNAPVTIEGHTDSRGSDQANLDLSQQRADAVRQYLLSQGLPPQQLKAMGRGEQTPIASNDNPEGRANNRRVELTFPAAAITEETTGRTTDSTSK